MCNHGSGRCKKIGIFPDLNPDLAGIRGISGIPAPIPDLAWIPGHRASRFGRDPGIRETGNPGLAGIGAIPPRCRGIGDFGVWQQQYMNVQHCAAASHAQYWADRCFAAETANAAENTTTAMNPVPNANERSREEHTQPQPAAPIAKGNFSTTTYMQAVMGSDDPPLIPVVERIRTRPNGRDSPTNAARASAAADPETSPTELRHSLAENAAAAALRTAAIAAAAAAKCEDPWILHTVLVAAAATANALAQTSAQDTVQAHRRGGRPPPMTRRRASPEPGPAETGGPLAQRQGPLAVAQCQPIRLASMIRQFTARAPQGQDEPDRNQEHNHPALATAPLRLQPATSRP